MRLLRLWWIAAGGVAGAVLLALGFRVATAAVTAHPLRTAIYFGGTETVGRNPDVYVPRVAATGATMVRLTVYWVYIAPDRHTKRFHARDPGDPAYRWGTLDQTIREIVAHGLTPFLTITSAPSWAQGPNPENAPNAYEVNVRDFGDFAYAVAKRYSGSYHGLPRVRYFEAWNEPNLSIYLTPQLVKRRPVGAVRYRRMLNAFTDAVHSVHGDNVSIAGGLAPFRDISPTVKAQNSDWGPLAFMRTVLCLKPDLQPSCDEKVKFDAWAMHPYTSGGPTHHAALPNDVSIADLPKVHRTLNAAIRAGHVQSSDNPPQFWVTEFSWDTNPPDPRGVPALLAARWVAQAMYVFWQQHVDVVTWLQIRDDPMSKSVLQSGLYYRSSSPSTDKAKPLLQAFRFPFVGFARARGLEVWGRTPAGKTDRVRIEQLRSGRWVTVATLATNRYGIFHRIFPTHSTGLVRAELVSTGERSRLFSPRPVPDHFFNPFGQPTLLEPRSKGDK